MLIRMLAREDIPATAAIVADNYDLETAELARKEFAEMFSGAIGRPKYYVVWHNNVIVAIAGYSEAWIDYGVYNIFWVNVALAHQRQGIGMELMKFIIAEIEVQHTHHFVQLTCDIPHYYRRLGFETVYTYQDGLRHLMVLPLE